MRCRAAARVLRRPSYRRAPGPRADPRRTSARTAAILLRRETNRPKVRWALRLEPRPWPGALAQDSAPRARWKVPRACPWCSTMIEGARLDPRRAAPLCNRLAGPVIPLGPGGRLVEHGK